MTATGLWAWDVSARFYAWTYGPLAHRLDDAVLAATGAVIRGGVVVDCGCGPGIVTAKLAAAGARRVIAIDVSQRMLDQVAPRANVVTVRDVVGPGTLRRLRAAYAPEGLALVLFKRSLYHPREEALGVLRDAWANLAPGGVVAVVHPEGDVVRYAFGEPARLRSYTPYHLFNRTVSRAGVRLGAEHYTTPRRAALLDLAREAAPDAVIEAVPLGEACFNLVVMRRPAATC